MLTQRSEEKELLDLGSAYYTAEEFHHCQKMLFKVNRLFGFFNTTVRFLKQFPKKSFVLDVGCGGGLFLLHLSNYFPAMRFLGIDISKEAIDIAKKEQKNYPNAAVLFQLEQQPTLSFPENHVDIVLATLVCHHLSDSELIEFLRLSLNIAKKAVLINDLQRSGLSQFFYRFISPILFRNRLITHDGLISIRRGFKRKEWKLFLEKAGIKHYKITWCFPFRWRVVLWKESL